MKIRRMNKRKTAYLGLFLFTLMGGIALGIFVSPPFKHEVNLIGIEEQIEITGVTLPSDTILKEVLTVMKVRLDRINPDFDSAWDCKFTIANVELDLDVSKMDDISSSFELFYSVKGDDTTTIDQAYVNLQDNSGTVYKLVPGDTGWSYTYYTVEVRFQFGLTATSTAYNLTMQVDS